MRGKTGWSTAKMKPGSTLKFEDGSSVTKTNKGAIVKTPAPKKKK